MNSAKEKELAHRSKAIAERLSESMHVLDHDPSMALYRLQEHINKTVGVLVTRKREMQALNSNLHGACFDLDNAIETVEQMKSTLPAFEGVHQKLRDSLYFKQQIDYRKHNKKENSSEDSSTNAAT